MKKYYHFIGIGGIGMSALARILLNRGEKVSGSDISLSPLVVKLKEEGAEIFIGHQPQNIRDPQAVIYSSDINKDNLEWVEAEKKGIPLLHRSELLALLMEGYAPLLVTGTHGKTTTSSLLAHTLFKAGLDPSYAVGGIIRSLGSNGRNGKGVYFAAEADESDGSFLKYPSFGAIITNLDNDHMAYWQTQEALTSAFKQFASQVGSERHLFWCHDDLRLVELGLKGYSYGFSEEADLKIDNFQQIGWKSIFDISFLTKHYSGIEIPLIGAHNVLNAAAVFGMGLKLNLPASAIKNALLSFEGVGRRAEKKGSVHQIDVFDDYAHHPTEIFATLRALKTASGGRKVVVAFQPHRYSRTRDCIEEFPEAFDYADELIITDIYAAREVPLAGITAESLLQKILKARKTSAHYVKRSDLTRYLANYLKPGDVLITMGAGDITSVGPEVLQELQNDETKKQ